MSSDYATLIRDASPLHDASTIRGEEMASTLTLLPLTRRGRESTGGCQVLRFAACLTRPDGTSARTLRQPSPVETTHPHRTERRFGLFINATTGRCRGQWPTSSSEDGDPRNPRVSIAGRHPESERVTVRLERRLVVQHAGHDVHDEGVIEAALLDLDERRALDDQADEKQRVRLADCPRQLAPDWRVDEVDDQASIEIDGVGRRGPWRTRLLDRPLEMRPQMRLRLLGDPARPFGVAA